MVDLLGDSEDGSDAAEVVLDDTDGSDADEESGAESLPAALRSPRPAEAAGQTGRAVRPVNPSRAGADAAAADTATAGLAGSQGAAAADGVQATGRAASIAVQSPTSAAGEARRHSQV